MTSSITTFDVDEPKDPIESITRLAFLLSLVMEDFEHGRYWKHYILPHETSYTVVAGEGFVEK